MPKVTLLGTEGKTYSIQHGSNAFVFRAGAARNDIPPVIALRCKSLKQNGKDLFKVEEMPEVVKPVGEKKARQNVVVETRLPIQKLRLFDARL